jgi:hypothetical protein
MAVVLPKDSKERTQAMLAVLRGETVTFERDGIKHTLTPDAGEGKPMADKDKSGAAVIFFGVILLMIGCVLFIGGLITGEQTANRKWQAEAVKHGAAQYNPTTAAFEWINQPSEVSGE